MIERVLMDHIEAYVNGLTSAPAIASCGAIEPATPEELPAVVLSIEESTRLGNGLGERSSLVTAGALPWSFALDLANPILAGSPPLPLLEGDRTRMTLPHGGLVRRDGSFGALQPNDIQVRLNEAALTLAPVAVAANEFSVDASSGALAFGAALPPTGSLRVSYVLGQWERRVARGRGVLRLVVYAGAGDAARDLSNALLAALELGTLGSIAGLSEFSVLEIGTIHAALEPIPPGWRRVLRFRFQFEQEINLPDSSGGIIQRIPVQAVLQ